MNQSITSILTPNLHSQTLWKFECYMGMTIALKMNCSAYDKDTTTDISANC